MLISGGSDSLTQIYGPPPWSQVLAILLLIAAIALTGDLGKWYRLACITGCILIFFMSVHLIVISGLSGDIREVLGIWTIRAFPYTSFDRSRPLVSSSGPLLLRFDNGHQIAHIFLGIPPWQIDGDSIAKHPILNPPPQ